MLGTASNNNKIVEKVPKRALKQWAISSSPPPFCTCEQTGKLTKANSAFQFMLKKLKVKT